MLKNAPKNVMLKPKQVYDLPGRATFDQRKEILHKLLQYHPKFVVKGGNSKNNPYKVQYELVLAERRNQLEYYKNSVLWSPRYTPKHFKYLFLYPAICVALLMLYLRYIQLPRRMLYYRKKYGYKFTELEQKGWLDGWIDDEIEEEVYQDWTIKDLEEFDKLTNDTKKEGMDRVSKIRQKNLHASLQSKFDQIYKSRAGAGLKTEESK